MNKIANQFTPLQQISDSFQSSSAKKSTNAVGSSFEEILQAKQDNFSSGTGELKFSKHASMRLNARNISLTQEQNQRLEDGVVRAGEKGINESLVLVDSLAFIVNVPNKTVVTAMNQSEATKNVFTNIDGAVIM